MSFVVVVSSVLSLRDSEKKITVSNFNFNSSFHKQRKHLNAIFRKKILAIISIMTARISAGISLETLILVKQVSFMSTYLPVINTRANT